MLIYIIEGWKRLINRLSKKSNEDTQRVEILVQLFSYLDFEKLQRRTSSEAIDNIQNFFRVEVKSVDTLTLIFDEMSRNPVIFSNYANVIDEFENIKQALQSILNQDFSKLFEILVLPHDQTVETESPGIDFNLHQEQKELFLEKFLTQLSGYSKRYSIEDKEMKLLRILLIVSSGSLSGHQDNKYYQTTIKEVIDDMMESSMLGIVTSDEDVQRRITRLLVGTLSWDGELIIQGLKMKTLTEESKILSSLFECFSIVQGQSNGEIKEKLKAVFSAMFKRVSMQTNSLKIRDGYKYKKPLQESNLNANKDLLDSSPMNDSSQISRNEGDVSPKKRYRNSTSLLRLTTKALLVENELGGPLQGVNSFESFFTSLCDGTLFTKLIDSQIQDQKLRIFLKSFLRFIIGLFDKFFSSKDQEISQKEISDSLEASLKALNDLVANDAWDVILNIAPEIFRIYMMFLTENAMDPVKFEAEILNHIKRFVLGGINHWDKKELLFKIVAITVGIDMNIPGNKKLKLDNRIELFLKEVLPELIPDLKTMLNNINFVDFYDGIVKIDKDLKEAFRDPKQVLSISKQLVSELRAQNCIDDELAKPLLTLMEGSTDGLIELARNIIPEEKVTGVQEVIDYVEKGKMILNGEFIRTSVLPFVQQTADDKKQSMSQDTWTAIFNKVKQGTALSKDLFHVLDQEGDQSGTISEKEFQTLTNRLGFKLSQHRITEIFAKVKGNKSKGVLEDQLNEREFEEALKYLETRNLDQALQLLGITPERLTGILIRLVLLLILIFAFIFSGIKAFAFGGTFGAIINSLFPLGNYRAYYFC